MKKSQLIWIFCVIITIMAVKNVESATNLTSLKFYYNLNSTLNLSDYSNGAALTRSGTMTWIPTSIDGGYNNTGNSTTGYLSHADDVNSSLLGNMTIGGIFYIRARNNIAGNDVGLIAKYYKTNGVNNRSFRLNLDSLSGGCKGNYSLSISSVGTTFTGCALCSNVTPTFNAWVDIVATYTTGTQQTIYVNGVKAGTCTASVAASIYDGDAVLGIGTLGPTSGTGIGTINGSVDEAWGYARVLTDQEILDYHNNRLANFGLFGNTTVAGVTNVSISNVLSESQSNSSCMINFTTNIPTNTTINYNTSVNLGLNISNTSYLLIHQINITGLINGTLYYFNITAYNSSTLYNSSGGYTCGVMNNSVAIINISLGINVSFNWSFDSGSLNNYSWVSNMTWNMTFKPDQVGCTGYDQCTTWFYFNSSNITQGQNFTLRFTNFYNTSGGYWSGSSSLPYQLCNISNINNWTRQGVREYLSDTVNNRILILNITALCNNPIIASWIPYTVNRTGEFIKEINGTQWVTVTVVNTTPQGFPLYRIKITNTNKLDKTIIVISGLHSSETYGDFMTEGMIRRLLNTTDLNMSLLRNNYVFYFYPNINTDGRYLGYSRYDNLGYDLNREWDSNNVKNVRMVREDIVRINQTNNIIILLDHHGNGGTTTPLTASYTEAFTQASVPSYYWTKQNSFTSNMTFFTIFDNVNLVTSPDTVGKSLWWAYLNINNTGIGMVDEYTQYVTTNVTRLLSDGGTINSAILYNYGYDSCTYGGTSTFTVSVNDNCTLNSQTLIVPIIVTGSNGLLTINGTVLSNKSLSFTPSTMGGGNFRIWIKSNYTLGVYK